MIYQRNITQVLSHYISQQISLFMTFDVNIRSDSSNVLCSGNHEVDSGLNYIRACTKVIVTVFLTGISDILGLVIAVLYYGIAKYCNPNPSK